LSRETWAAVDRYLSDLLVPGDDALTEALTAADAADLPPHHVAPVEGKLLHLLARVCGVRRVLEIGTLAGYSTIWLARAVPADGMVVTLEADPRYAAVARDNLDRAGVLDRIDLRVGPALDLLPELPEGEPFDLVFIDADKPNNPAYLEWAVRLSRPGTVIVADNVVRGGAVADPTSTDPNVVGVRRFLDAVAAHPRLDATALQTVGAKGYDGFAVIVVS
jgi:predicted O-methyltransferase YrrM